MFVVRVVPGIASYPSVSSRSSLSHRRVKPQSDDTCLLRLLLNISLVFPLLCSLYIHLRTTRATRKVNGRRRWLVVHTAVGCCCGTIIIPNGCLAPNPRVYSSRYIHPNSSGNSCADSPLDRILTSACRFVCSSIYLSHECSKSSCFTRMARTHRVDHRRGNVLHAA